MIIFLDFTRRYCRSFSNLFDNWGGGRCRPLHPRLITASVAMVGLNRLRGSNSFACAKLCRRPIVFVLFRGESRTRARNCRIEPMARQTSKARRTRRRIRNVLRSPRYPFRRGIPFRSLPDLNLAPGVADALLVYSRHWLRDADSGSQSENGNYMSRSERRKS